MGYYKVPCSYASVNAHLMKERLKTLAKSKPIIIYGAGHQGSLLHEYFTGNGFTVISFCDKDESKEFYCGLPVITPEKLFSLHTNSYVVVAVYGHTETISAYLHEGGIEAGNIIIPPFSEEQNFVKIPIETIPNEVAIERGYESDIDRFTPLANKPNCNSDKILVRTQVYNVPPFYLRRAIESVLNQTYTNFEYLIIDNASTDGSADIIKEYAEKDDRIKIITFEINSHKLDIAGQNERAEFICRQLNVQYSYFCVLDSDDYYEGTFLEKAHRLAVKHNADMVIGRTLTYWEDDVQDFYLRLSPIGTSIFQGTNKIIEMLCRYGVYLASSWGKLYKMRYFEDVCLLRFSLDIANIGDVMQSYKTIMMCNTIAITDEVLHYWTRRKNTLTLEVNENVKLVERYVYIYNWLRRLLDSENYTGFAATDSLDFLLYGIALGGDVSLLDNAVETMPDYVINMINSILLNETILSLKDDTRMSEAIVKMEAIKRKAEKYKE